jgi:copper transport protein
VRRVVVPLACVLFVLFWPAAPADAHAALLASSPAPGSVVGASPAEVTVTFTEPVAPVAGRIQVIAPDGERISGTPTARGAVLTIPVRRADRPLGTYLVSYRVISADSHPVAGALTFSVGAPSATPPAVAEEGAHRSVTVALPVVRWLGYAGLTLAIGPALLLAALWPRRTPRRGAVRLVWAGLAATALATVGDLWLQAPYRSGAPLWDVGAAEAGQVVASEQGLILLGRLAALALAAGLLPPVLRSAARRGGTGRERSGNGAGAGGRGRALALVAVTLGGLATWPLTGHAAAAPLSPVVVAADVVHMAAMAVWLGGLVTLAAVLLRRTHPRVLGVILPVWSRWAAVAVVWLVGAGVLQAVVQVGSVPALWRTDYGRLLVAKVGILAVTLGAAAYARRLVHRSGAVSTVRRTVGTEVAATAVVLGLSAVLVQVNPGRSATDDPAAVVDQGVSQTLTSDLYTLQFNIFPVQVGEHNTVHAFVYTPDGRPLPGREWSVTSVLTGRDLEPATTPMLGVLPRHHAIGALTFPLAGTYELRFTIRTSDIDQATVRTTVTVPAGRPAARTGAG